ncbi:MAG: flagellar basal-body rod protein FlgF [Verrucomicrobiota bacterium]|jgi:flagellar basal-body rod protein FlgG
MNVSLYQAAAALNASSRWQEMIAENLAASSIPGYKKQDLSFAAVQAGRMPVPGSGQEHFSLPQGNAATNFHPGELKATGVPTDVALEGRGFLPVQLADGQTAYTRDGELHISATGQLVTKQGFAVLGESGPIQLDFNNHTPISISATGEVSQGADIKGTLKAVDFAQPNLLTPISHGCFLATNVNLKKTDAETLFRQGYLEGANTSAATEMAHLITSMRMYEANQRVIQAQDERMGRAITELGNPN